MDALTAVPAWVAPPALEAVAPPLAIVLSYLLGAVPFGLVMVRLLRGVDLREVGSGNIGATNAVRAAGKPVGVLVFLLDCAKGWVAAAWISGLGPGEPSLGLQVACGASAVVGHCFPVYLGFRGGKGVATACGALAALDPVLLLVGAGVYLVVLLLTRYAGLGSIAMGIAFPVVAWIRGDGSALVVGAALLTLLILVRHRSNMARMLAGTEPKAFAGRRAGGSS